MRNESVWGVSRNITPRLWSKLRFDLFQPMLLWSCINPWQLPNCYFISSPETAQGFGQFPKTQFWKKNTYTCWHLLGGCPVPFSGTIWQVAEFEKKSKKLARPAWGFEKFPRSLKIAKLPKIFKSCRETVSCSFPLLKNRFTCYQKREMV